MYKFTQLFRLVRTPRFLTLIVNIFYQLTVAGVYTRLGPIVARIVVGERRIEPVLVPTQLLPMVEGIALVPQRRRRLVIIKNANQVSQYSIYIYFLKHLSLKDLVLLIFVPEPCRVDDIVKLVLDAMPKGSAEANNHLIGAVFQVVKGGKTHQEFNSMLKNIYLILVCCKLTH